MDSNELDIKRFLDIKQANGQSIYTIRSQRTVLLKLNRFLDGKLFRQTGEDDIMAFFGMLNGSCSESTIALSKIVVKSFYRQLHGMRRHEYPSQVINLVVNGGNKRKLPIRPEDVITKEDIVELLRWCDNFRDKAIVVTLYESGARLSEFININVGHLKFDSKGAVLAIDGKTGQRRIRLIESVPFLQRWLESHPHKQEPDAPLWCSIRSPFRRASDKVIEHFCKQLRKKNCFPKPTNPHSFRHSRITELAKYLSDAKLKVFAGWTGSSTMAGTYVHLAGADIEDDLLEIAGVKPEDESPKESPLRVKYCSRCNSKNTGVAEFCYLCGREDAIVVREIRLSKSRWKDKPRKEQYRQEAFLPLRGPRAKLSGLVIGYLVILEPRDRLFNFGTARAWQIVTAMLDVPCHWLRAYGENFLYDFWRHDLLAVADYVKVEPRTLSQYIRASYKKYPPV